MSIAKMLYPQSENDDSYYCNGILVGVVTDINDPEKLGRVKVKLLMRDSSAFETDFVRVMTTMSGKQWGNFFFPEVGDEVIVAFAGGDLTRPYVLGSLWNQEYKPPVEIQSGKNDIRQIKTKSGSLLTFCDEDGKERIEQITPKSLCVMLNDENEVIEIKDKGGKNIVKIDSKNGIVTVNAEKKIVIKTGNASIEMDGSANTIVLESSQSLKMKSQQISIEAKGGLQMKSSGNINIKSDGPVNIKGAVAKIN